MTMPAISPSSPSPDNRRGFLAKLVALGLAAVSLAVPAVAALAAFLNPWRQRAASGNWIRVASTTAIPAGGAPQRCPVIADRSDAWNCYPAEAVGAVFLRQTPDGKFVALQTICPHNGGCVSYDPEQKNYYCPSHGALFNLKGQRLGENGISPRDMDELQVEVRDGTEVWVKFEKFQDGTADRVLKS